MFTPVECYEQDDRKWGVAKDGVMLFVIDPDEVECDGKWAHMIASALNVAEELDMKLAERFSGGKERDDE